MVAAFPGVSALASGPEKRSFLPWSDTGLRGPSQHTSHSYLVVSPGPRAQGPSRGWLGAAEGGGRGSP